MKKSLPVQVTAFFILLLLIMPYVVYADIPVPETDLLPTVEEIMHTSILFSSNLTAQELDALIVKKAVTSCYLTGSSTPIPSKLLGQGEAFLKAEKDTGINALFLLSISAHESAWGSGRYVDEDGKTRYSQITCEKNNVFGWAAYDSSPYTSATGYPDPSDSIAATSNGIQEGYTTKTEGRDLGYSAALSAGLNPASLAGINVKYASDKDWAMNISRTVRSLMREVYENEDLERATAAIKSGVGEFDRTGQSRLDLGERQPLDPLKSVEDAPRPLGLQGTQTGSSNSRVIMMLYRALMVFARFLFWITNLLAMLSILVVVLLWSTYLLVITDTFVLSDWLRQFILAVSFNKLDMYSEGVKGQLIVTSLITLLLAGLILSGMFQQVMVFVISKMISIV